MVTLSYTNRNPSVRSTRSRRCLERVQQGVNFWNKYRLPMCATFHSALCYLMTELWSMFCVNIRQSQYMCQMNTTQIKKRLRNTLLTPDTYINGLCVNKVNVTITLLNDPHHMIMSRRWWKYARNHLEIFTRDQAGIHQSNLGMESHDDTLKMYAHLLL